MDKFATKLEGCFPSGRHKEMSVGAASLFFQLIMQKKEGKLPGLWKDDPKELPHLSRIVLARIMELELPIRFEPHALIAVAALCRSPGEAIVLLIDCLQHLDEPRVVTLEFLAEKLYPSGFYDEATLENFVDNYLKPKKVAWAEVY